MKKKLLVIAEITDTGYSAYIPEIPGCVTVGDTYDELKRNIREAIELYYEGGDESDLPKAVRDAKNNGFEIELKVDVKELLSHFQGIITKAGLEKITGISQNLLSQYAGGFKNPSEKQAKR